MINEIIKYVNHFFKMTKEQHTQTDDVIIKSVLICQYLYHKHFNIYISVDDILELNNNDIGLIGPGNGCITYVLERNLGWIDVFHSHSILHDVFGRFYDNYSLDRGYTYAIPKNLTSKQMKKSPLCGQISGLIYCTSKRIII